MRSVHALPIDLPRARLRGLCEKWRIAEFALFGSVLRPDFGPASDIDVLVTWAPGAEWSILDHLRMEKELGEILGRPTEIVSRRAVEEAGNWIRTREIFSTAWKVAVA